METFYWYDYETWGANTRLDKPVQFAGVRTDLNFNIIGEPLELYCKPSLDLLPHPEACLIHGITPQIAEEKGVYEYQFAAMIHEEFSKSQTCIVGFNNIKFDDEVTRHLFYRNFYDPYEWAYRNGNSRWDILKLVRACYALRPDGINWPVNEEGRVTFKLESLAAANKISHNPHDAVSDVFATLNLARLIKEKQPKLFDYYLKFRSKTEASRHLDLNNKKPVLHVSGMFPVERHCAALVMPLAKNPVNDNEVICFDLSVNPDSLMNLNADEIHTRIFSTKEELQELGLERFPLKNIRINQSPMLCQESVLNDVQLSQRLQIDRDACKDNYEKILVKNELIDKIRNVHASPPSNETTDVENMLYSAFIPDVDKYLMQKIRKLSGYELADKKFDFIDKRLPELLFRYRARNFFESLDSEEKARWISFCHNRLTNPAYGGTIQFDIYNAKLVSSDSEIKNEIFPQLSQYGNNLFHKLLVLLDQQT